MTVTEIRNLRKSGHIQEALTAAEKEFTQSPNKYTAGALFWCLYDLSKNQSGDDAADTIERIESIYNEFGNGDELMHKALKRVESKICPHYQEVKDAVENAKNGIDSYANYQKVSTWYKEGILDIQLYQDFGWLIYYALKHSDNNDVQWRKSILYQYLQLNLPKPSILHSQILREAVKLEQNYPLQFRIRDFIKIWGLDYIRDEDWEQFQTNNGSTPSSLVEKLIKAYTKELKNDSVESSEEFNLLVDKALIKYPNNQYMPYYKATILISEGNIQEALKYYKKLIIQSPTKSYLWEQAAELIEDIDTKIGLLCKALTGNTDDEFLGKMRFKLAFLLQQKGLNENAKYELDKYKETYQDKGWKLKPEFWQKYNELTPFTSAPNNKTIYDEYTIKADEFIYSSFPTIVAIKLGESINDDRNRPGKKIITWTLRTENDFITLRKPIKFGLKKCTPNGTVFDTKIMDGKIVWIKQHIGSIAESWLKEVSGEVRIRIDKNGRKYAIVSGSYVSENLLKGIEDGQYIKIQSILQKDGRWKAVAIL